MATSVAESRGIAALTFAMAGYAANDTIVKVVARDLPFGEIMFFRGMASVVFLAGVMAATGALRTIGPALQRPVLIRAFFDGIGSGFFVAALVHMKLADVSAIALTAPLIMTALAVVIYRETVGWRRWTAILVGLFGTLLIVKPGAGSFDLWALVALAAAFSSAGRDLSTRRVDPAIPSLAISIYGSLAVTLVGAAMGLNESWRMPSLAEFGMIALAGLALAIASYLVVIAFRGADIAVVAPFRYTLLLWAALGGYIAFGEVLDRWSIAGAALIVGSGIYTIHRETVRRRLITARSLPPE